ncbi:midasin (AAA ATPase) [Apiospora arundinis]
MSFPGSNPTNPLEGLPRLDPLPDDIDIFTLYRQVFCTGSKNVAADTTSSVNWWYHGFVTIQGHGAPPLLMLEAHNLVSCRQREKDNADELKIDWVMLVQFDDLYSGGPSTSIHNPLTGHTAETPSPFFHPPGTFTVNRKSNSELGLLIERPGIPSYQGEIIAGLLRNDHRRVCLIQTQPQEPNNKNGTDAYTQLTLMLTVDLSEARGGNQSAGSARSLPGRGVFWGFQHGPLNTLFGFDEGIHGDFRTQGKLVKGDHDEAVVPGLWARYKKDFPDFFDGAGALSPDWDGLLSGRLRGDELTA